MKKILFLTFIMTYSLLAPAENFANLPDITGSPQSALDKHASAFFDLGAWHGFGLPEANSSVHQGAFTGPLLLDYQQWFSGHTGRLEIAIDGKTHALGANRSQTYLPGRLERYYQTDTLAINLELTFTNANTAAIKTRIKNISHKTITLSPSWSIEPWPKVEAKALPHGIEFMLPANATESELFLHWDWSAQGVIFAQSSTWKFSAESLPLAAGTAYTFYQTITLATTQTSSGQHATKPTFTHQPLNNNDNDNVKEATRNQAHWAAIEHDIATSHARWQGYLQILEDSNKLLTMAEQRIAVKSLNTLLSNYRIARGDLPGHGFFPSYHQRWFNGFWAWDSWKHAAGIASLAPDLARAQITTQLALINEDGMLPDVIYTNSNENNWRNSKPPLAAWATWLTYLADPNEDFLEQVWPSLMANHRWWYKFRDHDQNGICEFGATDGTLEAAAWESGMDNAVRFDQTQMLENSANAWSMNQESIDLNSFLYAEKHYLAKIARILKKTNESLTLEQQASQLKEKIQTYFLHDNYYFDITLNTHSAIGPKGPEAWVALWAGVASEETARAMAASLLDPTLFNSYLPFPTLNVQHADFAPEKGYWRGPVWFDQAYFAISGLRRYGLHDTANLLQNKLLDRAQDLNGAGSLRENYNPTTGKGLNAQHFSWTAAHLLLLLEESRKNSGD